MVPSDPGYVHGTHPEEQARLSKLNSLLNKQSLAALQLGGGERILDVGSGLGQLSLAMAQAAGPAGSVLGIERSDEQLSVARARVGTAEVRVEFRRGDALDPPLTADEWGSFDVAHARFVLEHVENPIVVVRALARAVRPGGRIILEDDDHDVLRIWPPSPGVERLWRGYIQSYESAGKDPYVGRHLVSLLHEAGACPRRNRWLSFSGCSGSDTFGALVANLRGILEGARSAIMSATGVTTPDYDNAIEELDRWGRRPDAALWYGTCWAEAIVPGKPVGSHEPDRRRPGS
ncbi:MAG: methyltransferase domain-containing protein [Myxococcales bacterium]|nr:methyltransferase domain-containing protein [Myxococcales bacterium]